jgi:fatty-acyl-CoA synthase
MIGEALKRTTDAVRGRVTRTVTIVRVARTSGLSSSLTARGLMAVAATMLSGANNPALVYRVHAMNRPDAPAIVTRQRTLSFADVWNAIARVASALRKRGVGRGTSVLLVLRNRPEFVIAQNAASLIGAAAVSASPHATVAELTHLATHSGAAVAVTEEDLLPSVREATGEGCRVFVVGEVTDGAIPWDELASAPIDRAALWPDDEGAVVVYTSGTTGRPKGAVRKFPKETFASAMQFIAATPMRAGDVHLVVAPLYHSTAYAFATMTHLLGGTIVLLDAFSPAAFLDALERYQVTTTAVVPTMLHRVVEHIDQLHDATRPLAPSLGAIFSGGAPLSGALATRVMDALGDVLFNFYGATETGLVTLATPADLRRAPGTIGRAVPGVEVRLVDEHHRSSAQGELYARSPLLSAGYLREPDATRAATLEGFFSVGDLARVDEHGLYFLEGRKRELIISGGVNVYPVEVEHALEEHPAVAEAAVVGAADEEWGERVRAFVVLRHDARLDAEELRAWMKTRVAGPKVPRDVFFLPTLPRNPTGKVLKNRLAPEPPA